TLPVVRLCEPEPIQPATPHPSTHQPSAPLEPHPLESQMKLIQQQMDQMMATLNPQIKKKHDPFDLLPPVEIPVNCRLDYPKYNGTGDPSRHIRTFRSRTRAYASNKALLGYLFQYALEGEPQDWYYDLAPSNLRDFDTVEALFLEKYQHCTSYIPTITDLVKEKMKPDEDIVAFIQRWRTLAARSTCVLSEKEQIQMITSNTLPHIHSWISITGCPTNFTQLYERGAEVQSALKDPSFKLYASRSKFAKKDQGPVTEGVHINEQISLVNQRPSHPMSTYSQVAPPNNYAPRKVGPRRAEYPPFPEKL